MDEVQSISLIPVVKVDEKKCVNCHACITACPVKFCNDGNDTHVKVNADMCIACGSCITACTHEARTYLDDFDEFLNDLNQNKRVIAVVAPAIAASFPNQYLKLNGWLKSIGIQAIFDVSFGAELTIRSYVEHIKKNKPELVIAQPCPSLVTYIQLYQPELIKYLAPADSPILHTIKLVREYYKQYNDCKVALISPCNAKKREFQQTGIGDYNVAFKSIDSYLKLNSIDLNSFEEVDFDNPSPERAVMFSSPGGLLQTLERTYPEFVSQTRVIEGTPKVYEYLKKLPSVLADGKAPLLIDCLSCEYGCNSGPFTLTNDMSVDEMEYWVKKRREKMIDLYKSSDENNEMLSLSDVEEIVSDYWKDGLYDRTYQNLWKNITIEYPTPDQLEDIFKSMHKYTPEQQYNCSSCGYGRCKDMATAIFNKLNRPQNCHFYLESENELSHKAVVKSEQRISSIIETSLDGFFQIDNQNIIVSANPAMKLILKRNDIVGRNLMEFFDTENSKIVLEQIELRKSKVKSSYEVYFSQSGGKLICCLVSASPLLDEHGEKIGSFALVSDISKLKAAEKELKQMNESLEQKVTERTAELTETVEELRAISEKLEESNVALEKLSIVASKTNNAILIMDKTGDVEWVNDAFTFIHGYNLENLIQKFGKNIVQISSNPEIEDVLKECFSTKKAVQYNTPNLKEDGHRYWLQTTLSPVLNDNNEIIKIVAIDTDISLLKDAEDEIIQQNEELKQQSEEILAQSELLNSANELIRESEQKMMSIIDFLPDATLVIDENKKIIAWNQALEKLTGLKAFDMIGKGNYAYSVPFYGEPRPMLIDYAIDSIPLPSNFYIKTEISSENLVAEIHVPNLNGKEYFLMGAATLLYDNNEKVIGAIEIIKDITQRKREEIELQKAYDQLQLQNDKINQQNEEILQKSVELSEAVEELRVNNEIIQTTNDELQVKNDEIERNKDEMIKQNKILRLQQKEIVQQSRLLEKANLELQKLSIVASQTSNGVIITDSDGHFEWVNDGFTKLCGYTLAELIEIKGTIIGQSNAEFINRCKESKETVTYEYFAPHKSGGGVWLKTTLTPILNDFNEVIKLIAIDTDISEIKEAQEKINKQNAEITAKSLELSELVEEIQVTNEMVFSINKDLEQNNAEIELQRQELITQNELLQKQKTEIETHRDQIAHQKKHITDSILYAKRIQNAILTSESTVTRLFPHNFVLYMPRDIVSGDFYLVRQRNTKIYMVVADCTGHGVPGAFMSMLGVAFLNEIINNIDKNENAGVILDLLKAQIVKAMKQKGKIGEAHDGMDIGLCVLNFDNRTLQFAGANNPLYLYRNRSENELKTSISDFFAHEIPPENQYRIEYNNDSTLLELKGDDMPIGIFIKDAPFRTHEISFRKGDNIYLFSDGYVSQFGGPKGRKFLTKNFKSLLFSMQNKDMIEQKQILQSSIEIWKNDLEQIDDILVFGVKV